MLQSHLLFCPYIQCVCLRISKKIGGNQEINSINSILFFSPMFKCQVATHHHKANRSKTAWESKETVVCFDSGVVKGSALTKQREQKSSSESTVQEASLVFCPLRPGSQCQGWPLWRKKVQGPNGRLMLFVPVRQDRQLHSWLLVCSGLHSVPRQERPKGLCVKMSWQTNEGQTTLNWDLTEGKWKYDFVSQTKKSKYATGWRLQDSTGRSVSSFAIPQKRSGSKKICQKRGEKNTNAGCLGEEKTKTKQDYPLKNSNKRFPVWTTGLQNIPTHLGGGKKKEKKKNEKGLPSKDTSVLYISTNRFLVPPEDNSIKIFQLSPSFILNWTLLISEITINWAGHLERFRPVVEDHLCLGVFFFRFRLKKQQHLQTETDIKLVCRWERLQMKQKKEEKKKKTRADCLYISVLDITRA